MDRRYIDVDGLVWVCHSYDYMENTTEGHKKFYRTAHVSGPFGEWEFTQWGRIGADTLTAQRQCWPMKDMLSRKLAEKRAKGYVSTVDIEVPRLAWVAIVASIKAARLGPPVPDWVGERVPEGGLRK